MKSVRTCPVSVPNSVKRPPEKMIKKVASEAIVSPTRNRKCTKLTVCPPIPLPKARTIVVRSNARIASSRDMYPCT
jgi:hypothetical protein